MVYVHANNKSAFLTHFTQSFVERYTAKLYERFGKSSLKMVRVPEFKSTLV